jgi:hypothetical protein
MLALDVGSGARSGVKFAPAAPFTYPVNAYLQSGYCLEAHWPVQSDWSSLLHDQFKL